MKAKYYSCVWNHLWKVAWGEKKKEKMFNKNHSSKSSYTHLFQIFNLWKKKNHNKRETQQISALDQQQVSFSSRTWNLDFQALRFPNGPFSSFSLTPSNFTHPDIVFQCYTGEMPSGCSLHSLRYRSEGHWYVWTCNLGREYHHHQSWQVHFPSPSKAPKASRPIECYSHAHAPWSTNRVLDQLNALVDRSF